MNDAEFDLYVQQAEEALARKQQALEAEFGIGRWERFEVDYPARVLRFLEQGRVQVECTILPLSSYKPSDQILQWAWANKRYPDDLREAASVVRGLHDLTGLAVFHDKAFVADDAMAWQVVAIACKFTDALGAYRVPHGAVDSYVLITDVRRPA